MAVTITVIEANDNLKTKSRGDLNTNFDNLKTAVEAIQAAFPSGYLAPSGIVTYVYDNSAGGGGGSLTTTTTGWPSASGATEEGKLYALDNGEWEEFDVDNPIHALNRVAIAIGSDPEVDGMLLEGNFINTSWNFSSTDGDIVYAADVGAMTLTCPSKSSNPYEVIRPVGFVSSASGVYFQPVPGGTLDGGT